MQEVEEQHSEELISTKKKVILNSSNKFNIDAHQIKSSNNVDANLIKSLNNLDGMGVVSLFIGN